MRISDWSSDVCSSDLRDRRRIILHRGCASSGRAQPSKSTFLSKYCVGLGHSVARRHGELDRERQKIGATRKRDRQKIEGGNDSARDKYDPEIRASSEAKRPQPPSTAIRP